MPILFDPNNSFATELELEAETAARIAGDEAPFGLETEWTKLSTQVTANANQPAYTIPENTAIFKVDSDSRVHMGENRFLYSGDTLGSTMHSSVIDAMYESGTMRFYSRSLILAEVGDSPEVQLRRAGPDNTYPGPDDGVLTGVLNAQTLGQITWYPFVTPTAGTPDVTRGFVDSPAGAIYMHAAQDAYEHKVGGEMYFSTTPIDAGAYVNAVAIMSNQHIFFQGSDIAHFSVTNVEADAANKVAIFRAADSQTANIFEVQKGGSHNDAFFVAADGSVGINTNTKSAAIRVNNPSAGQSIAEFRDSSGANKVQFLEAGGVQITNGLGINGKNAASQSADTTAQATTASTQTTPYGFTTQAQADAIATHLNDIRTCLRNHGLMA